MNLTVVVGNPKPASRTLGVARAAADALADGMDLGDRPEIVDLAGLARRLLLPEPSAAIEDAVDRVRSADLLLVASPTFKGTYSGLLKVFFDRLPYRALSAATALPLLVMNSRRARRRGRGAPAPAADRARRHRARSWPGRPGFRARAA